MWGGRFAGGPADVMREINASIGIDKRMWAEDIEASRAHAAMLGACGIIGKDDAAAIDAGLSEIAAECAGGDIPADPALEDIHMNVESRLREKIGDAAGRLHTARSRNDQVATDFRLWVRGAIDRTAEGIAALQGALLDRAEEHADNLMPGFTHLQGAQPVTLGHHLMAYYEMLRRDASRFADARARMNESPLGCAALAGTGFAIDRDMTAKALGFDRPTRNSLDAVSDRDFALDFLGAGLMLSLHLSRLAEEIVIWASQPFSFVALPDSFSTGSSIMPQKRNPDAAELLRAKPGELLGALTQLSVLMKGLPLAYAKDMQDDKAPVFRAADTLMLSLAAMTGMVRELTFKTARMADMAESGHSTATDLADWLVREAGVPFRDAHHIVGSAVALAEREDCRLADLPLEALQQVDDRIGAGVYDVLAPEKSVASRTSYGGTAPSEVLKRVKEAREAL